MTAPNHLFKSFGNKRLVYLMNMRLPNEYAHSIQIVKTCEALGNLSIKVDLILPLRWQFPRLRNKDIWKYYNLKRNSFRIILLPCLDLFHIFKSNNIYYLRMWALLGTVSFYFIAFLYLLFKDFAILYTREYEAGIIGRVLKVVKEIKFYYEAHLSPTHSYEKTLLSFGSAYADMIYFTTPSLLKHFQVKAWLKKRGLVLPNGVDSRLIKDKLTKVEARQRLGLDTKAKLIVYTGQLFPWKGVSTLIKSQRYLARYWQILIVGGLTKDIKILQKLVAKDKIRGVYFLGRKNPQKIFTCLRAADVLVLPNSQKFTQSRLESSPMKLFEYMAARRPIVASRVPAITAILQDRKNALLFKPDNSKDLARKIEMIRIQPALASKLAKQAGSDARQYTWENRARKIINSWCQ